MQIPEIDFGLMRCASKDLNVICQGGDDYLAGIPEAYFKSSQRFYRRLMLDAGSHYPLHTEMIQNWRKEKGY